MTFDVCDVEVAELHESSDFEKSDKKRQLTIKEIITYNFLLVYQDDSMSFVWKKIRRKGMRMSNLYLIL